MNPFPYITPLSFPCPHINEACLQQMVAQRRESTLASLSRRGSLHGISPLESLRGREPSLDRTQPGTLYPETPTTCRFFQKNPRRRCCQARGTRHGEVDVPTAAPERSSVSASLLARAGVLLCLPATPSARFCLLRSRHIAPAWLAPSLGGRILLPGPLGMDFPQLSASAAERAGGRRGCWVSQSACHRPGEQCIRNCSLYTTQQAGAHSLLVPPNISRGK